MSYESNVSYVSKQLRQKNTHNLRNMKTDSARRISCCPSSILHQLKFELFAKNAIRYKLQEITLVYASNIVNSCKLNLPLN